MKYVEENCTKIVFMLIGNVSNDGLHILLADDDEDDRELLRTAMAVATPDIILSTVVNGKELIGVLHDLEREKLPDVILLDLNMPLKSGPECLEEIRADKRLAIIPVIIYSTSKNRDILDEMYDKGADYYIGKPSSFVDLKLIAQKVGTMKWEGHIQRPRNEFVLF